MPNEWRTIDSWVHKIRLHGRRGKETAESFSREKLRQAPPKEVDEKFCVNFLPSTSLMSGIDGMTAHTHTATLFSPFPPSFPASSIRRGCLCCDSKHCSLNRCGLPINRHFASLTGSTEDAHRWKLPTRGVTHGTKHIVYRCTYISTY